MEEPATAAALIGSPPRPTAELEEQKDEEAADGDGGNASIGKEVGAADLELLTEKLRNLGSGSRSSPGRRRAVNPRGPRMSNSTHQHPLLPESATTEAEGDNSQFSGSPVLSEGDDDDDLEGDDDDDDDSEILATLSPPVESADVVDPSLLAAERTSPFPEAAAVSSAGGGGADEEQNWHRPEQSSTLSSVGPPPHHASSSRRDDHSAESLALSLLGGGGGAASASGSDPRVCELKWLVGEWESSPKVCIWLILLLKL